MTTVATTTTPAARPSPAGASTLSRRTAPTGAPARAAARAATSSPTSQPVTVPATATDRALDPGQQPQVPAPGAVPGEAAPGCLQIPPHAPGREHREGEQERCRLAADEQEPPPGDGGRALAGAQLLDGRPHAWIRRSGRTAPPGRARSPRRGRRSARASAGRRRAATPRRSSGRCWRPPARSSAHRSPRRRRVARAAADGSAAARCRAGATSRSARALSVGARKSPKSWLDRSVAVPTCTSRSPGAFGRAPSPRRRTTSQRAGVQRRGSLPLVRLTCGPRPSTPASETK